MSAERQGLFVAVVGASGAGKDTLMRAVEARLGDRSDILFAQRVITRDADPQNEDHETMPRAAFAEAWAQGAFCIAWEAHGLSYALRKEVADHVASGGTVVANLSRAVLSEAASRFVRMDVLEIAARPDVRAARLVARGRECVDDIRSRVTRDVPITVANFAGRIVTIENSGGLDDAAEKFENYLRNPYPPEASDSAFSDADAGSPETCPSGSPRFPV